MGNKSGCVASLVRKSALDWARRQIGSEKYSFRAALGKWKSPSWKCNAFVIRAFNHNVMPAAIGEKKESCNIRTDEPSLSCQRIL